MVESNMGAVAWDLRLTPRFPSPLIGRVEDWRAALGRSLCSPVSSPRLRVSHFPHKHSPVCFTQGLWDLSWRGEQTWRQKLLAVLLGQQFLINDSGEQRSLKDQASLGG
jgi:hypothetical protein